MELVDEYKDYSVENLPKLGKHLMVPSNNPKMEIDAVVTVQLHWFANKQNMDTTNIIYQEDFQIPVSCSLCITP